MTPTRRLGVFIAAAVFLLDQASKLWLLFGLGLAENGPYAVAPFMDIVLAWNRGISYGLFQQGTDIGRWALVVISFVAAVWLARWMWREPRRLTVASLALIIGGALGNGVDRTVYGAGLDLSDLDADVHRRETRGKRQIAAQHPGQRQPGQHQPAMDGGNQHQHGQRKTPE